MTTLTLSRSPQAIAGTPGALLLFQNLAPARMWISESNSALPGSSIQSAGYGGGATAIVAVSASGSLFIFSETDGGQAVYLPYVSPDDSDDGSTGLPAPTPLALLFDDPFDGVSLDSRWTASDPSKVSVGGGKLVHTGGATLDSNQVAAGGPRLEGKMVLRIAAGTANAGGGFGPYARGRSDGACYLTSADFNGELTLFAIAGDGSLTGIVGGASHGGYNFQLGYEISIETVGTGPTLTITELRTLAGTFVASVAVFDTTAALQLPGSFGVENFLDGTPVAYDSARLYARDSLPIVLGQIGTSVTRGAEASVPEVTGTGGREAASLQAITGRPVVALNRAQDGSSTLDWVPGGTYLPPSIAAFAAAATTHITIEMGPNDAQGMVASTTATFLANLQAICAALFAGVPTLEAIVLHGAPFHRNLGNQFSALSISRLLEYRAALPSICTGSIGQGILLGDMSGFNLFAQNAQYIADGVHPPDVGAAAWGFARASRTAQVCGL